MGIPPIFPPIDAAKDIRVGADQPDQYRKTPTSSTETGTATSPSLSFNSSLTLEMRRIAFVDRLLDLGWTCTGFRKDLYPQDHQS